MAMTKRKVGAAARAQRSRGKRAGARTTAARTTAWKLECKVVAEPSIIEASAEPWVLGELFQVSGFTPGDKKVRWTHKLAQDVPQTAMGTHAIARAGDVAIVWEDRDSDHPSMLWGLDAATGKVRWSRAIDLHPYHRQGLAGAAMAVDAGVVIAVGYIGEGGGGIVAFDPATGKERWSVDDPGDPVAIAVAGGTIYVGGDDGLSRIVKHKRVAIDAARAVCVRTIGDRAVCLFDRDNKGELAWLDGGPVVSLPSPGVFVRTNAHDRVLVVPFDPPSIWCVSQKKIVWRHKVEKDWQPYPLSTPKGVLAHVTLSLSDRAQWLDAESGAPTNAEVPAGRWYWWAAERLVARHGKEVSLFRAS
jgi:outer membrane protein assembly factor BamB